MPAFSRRSIAIYFCLMSLPAVGQQTREVKIGVALLGSAARNASPTDARDQLVDAINRHKPDSKGNFSMRAVALESRQSSQALADGRNNRCEFVLYTRVEALEKGSRTSQEIHGPGSNSSVANLTGASSEADTVLLEYELRRATDGSPYAIGMVKSQEASSPGEAIFNAIQYIPNKVSADLRNPANGPAEIANAQVSPPRLNRDQYQGPNFCAWLPKDTPHADALRAVCEHAVTEPEKLPNFVCQEEVSRYRGRDRVPTDLITATIRSIDGEESYRDIQNNGKPAPGAMWRMVGNWSSGQFDGDLRNIFDAGNHATFTFSGETNVGARRAWIFTFQISRQFEPLWEIRAQDQLIAPPYGGELWVDRKSGEVLHFRSTAKEMPSAFPVRSAETLTDYDDVAFPDGTGFALPVKSTVVTRYRQEAPTRNVVEFHGCHKFRASAHMLLSAAESGPEEVHSLAATAAELAAEAEENEKIYDILREEAVAEDALRMDSEEQHELKGATGELFWRLAQLEKQRQQVLAANLKNARSPYNYEIVSTSSGATTFRVKVKLVPVSIVVRDDKGRALGNLTQDDFQILDNRKPQEISSFSLEQSAGTHASKEPGPAGSDRKRFTRNNVAYVFDDLHTTSTDLARTKAAAERHLNGLPAGDLAAVFTTSGDGTLDFTANHEKLLAALKRVKPHGNASPTDCPAISYYAADAIVNQADANAMQMAIEDATECLFPDAGPASSTQQGSRSGPNLPNFQQQGEMEKSRRVVLAEAVEVANVGRMESDRALSTLHEVFSRTAAMPGRRSIVLLSPGFLAVTPEEQRGVTYLIERALKADVVFSTLDVRGLAPNMPLSANRSHLNEPTETRVLDSQEEVARTGVLEDLAYGTGGTYFHHNNDLDAGLRRTADPPEFVYVLGFAPQKLDGKLHQLKVRVRGSAKLTVQARQGYYALKAPVQAAQ